MSLSNVRKNSAGFTLIETLIIVVIVGILSAIAAPSFLGLFGRNKVDNALNELRGALQEAQREAIRKSKSCIVTINTADKKITSPCLVTGTRDLCDQRDDAGNCTKSRVALATNLNPNTITFSFRGNTTNSGAIVVYASDNSNSKQGCFVISNGLGIMRTGNFTRATSSTANITAADVTAGTCTTSQ